MSDLNVMTGTESQSLDARLQRLEAIEAIHYLKHRYGELVDRLAERSDPDDLEALGELFTEDAFVDFVSVQLPGRKAVVELYSGIQQHIAWLWHSFHSPVIEIDGERASGRWTLQGITINQGNPVPNTVYGRYRDEFVRTARGWRISRMQLILGPAGTQAELRHG